MDKFTSFSLLAGAATAISGVISLYVYKRKVSTRFLHCMLALSAGLLFAIATLDLIPEALATASATDELHDHNHVEAEHDHDNEQHDHEHDHLSEQNQRLAMLGLGIGFFLMISLEQLSSYLGFAHSHGDQSDHHHHPKKTGEQQHSHTPHNHAEHHPAEDSHEHEHDHHHLEANIKSSKADQTSGVFSSSFSMIAFVALSLHSFVDGLAIAGAFSASEELGTRVALGIAIHKIPDALVMATLLASSKIEHSLLWLIAFSLVTPLGAGAGKLLFTNIPKVFLGCVLGFASGTFLYITAAGMIPELTQHNTKTPRSLILLALAAGYSFFLFAQPYLHAH